MPSVNVDIRRWKIRSRFLFVIQALLVCVFGRLSVYKVWNCSENANFFLVKSSGTLVLISGALQLLIVVCTCVPVDRRKLENMFAAYVLWSLWVIMISACHWVNIYEHTQTLTDLLTISTVLMSLHAILMIVQCVVFGVVIKKLGRNLQEYSTSY